MKLISDRRTRRPRRTVMVAGCALVVTLAGVLATSTAAPVGAVSSRSARTTSPPFGVGVARCTFVDHSRSALNYTTTPYRVIPGGRTLVTEIRYPITPRSGGPAESNGATPLPQTGGYPMVVFAHGYDVTPDTYAKLLDAWVRQGFVVVAPFFPDESATGVAAQHGVNTENDLANEPGDITFLTRSILASSANDSSNCHVVSGLVNPSQLGLAGHSDGAEAVGMLAYDHGNNPQGVNFAELRTGLAYRAVILLSGAEETTQSYADEALHPNLLVVQSLADRCNPMRFGVQIYDAIHQSNKWFLELQTAHHLPPFDGVDAPALSVVVATTVPFLRASLLGITPPVSLLTLGNERPTVARMFVGAPGPSMKDVKPLKEFCSAN